MEGLSTFTYPTQKGYNLNLLNCEFTKVVFLTENGFQIVLIHILCRGFVLSRAKFEGLN